MLDKKKNYSQQGNSAVLLDALFRHMRAGFVGKGPYCWMLHEGKRKVQITFFPCSFQAAVSPGYSRQLENPQAVSKVRPVTAAGSGLGTVTSEALSRLID